MSLPRGPVRGGGRLALLVAGALLLGAATYLWHDAHSRVAELRRASDKCLQHQEALAAQLQVIFEYKLRLEKSLQQEKNDHRQTRESLQARAEEERSLRERQSLEAGNRYTSLQQQYKLLQSQHDDLEEETQKLRTQRLEWLEEKSSLERSLAAVQQELQQLRATKATELDALKDNYLKLKEENARLLRKNSEVMQQSREHLDRTGQLQREVDQLRREKEHVQDELSRCERGGQAGGEKVGHAPPGVASPGRSSTASSRVEVAPRRSDAGAGVGARPSSPSSASPLARVDAPDKQSKSSTPKISPLAVQSREKAPPPPPPPPAAPAAATEKAAAPPPPAEGRPVEARPKVAQASEDGAVGAAPPLEGHHYDVPRGVVPAPHGYGLQHQLEEAAAGEEEEENEGVAGYPWRPVGAIQAQPIGVGPAPPGQERRRDAAGPHEHRPHKDVLADVRRREDYERGAEDYLQEPDKEKAAVHNEDPEEEEDDDVDQIDYGDGPPPRPPPAVGGAAPPPAHRPREPPLPVGPRESVMVNPK